MSKKIIFSVEKSFKITYSNNSFKETDNGYYLNCRIENENYNITYLGSNIKNIDLDVIKNLIEPTNIHSMMHVNLNIADCNAIINALEKAGEYYFALNSKETIKYTLLNDSEIKNYNVSLKVDMEDAIKKYGAENVTLVRDIELYMYYISCYDDGIYENYKDNYYSMEYIDNDFVNSTLLNFNCRYEVC